MKKYKFIFWDMDGTLANTYEGVTNCVKYAMEPYGIHLEGEAEVYRTAASFFFYNILRTL